MYATGVLACRVKPANFRGAVGREHHAAHHVVRGGNDLDAAGGEIEAAVGAALDHAFELAPHIVGPQMSHGNPYAAIGRRMTLADAIHDRAADNVAGGAFTARMVFEHETGAGGVDQ